MTLTMAEFQELVKLITRPAETSKKLDLILWELSRLQQPVPDYVIVEIDKASAALEAIVR